MSEVKRYKPELSNTATPWPNLNVKLLEATMAESNDGEWIKASDINRIKAQAFIAGAEWQECAQAFDYDIGIDTQREKAAAEYANKLEGEE